MLTRKQYLLLKYIHESVEKSGYIPSYEEMRISQNQRSKAGIHRLVASLEERGYIRRLPNRARAIEIIKLPKNLETDQKQEVISADDNPTFSNDNVIKSAVSKVQSAVDSVKEQVVSIPVMGAIAAGVPIEAIQNQKNTITVPENMISGGEHFALEVNGDSMIDEGIFDGDTVVVQKVNSANNGEIVVALIDQEEATLKRLRKRGTRIALEAANSDYETRIYGPDRVSVQGKLVGLYRRY